MKYITECTLTPREGKENKEQNKTNITAFS